MITVWSTQTEPDSVVFGGTLGAQKAGLGHSWGTKKRNCPILLETVRNYNILFLLIFLNDLKHSETR